MVETRKWIAYFSQTGSEIVYISKQLGRWPDRIITNKRPEHLRTIHPDIPKELLMWTQNKPEVHEYDWLMRDFVNPIVTLHGWLRVVPAELCNKYEIYNGHPGLITRYPELKGKDPQMKAWELDHHTAGCVIHKVTAGVDEGEILMEREFGCRLLDLDGLFRKLHETSTGMWIEFLHDKLWLSELH